MSKSYELQHSVDYLKNHKARFILKSMGREEEEAFVRDVDCTGVPQSLCLLSLRCDF